MPERRLPERDLHLGTIGLAAAAIAAVILATVGAVLGWLHLRGVPPGGERLERDYELAVPGPRLQSAPQPELTDYIAQKRRQLDGSGWVDVDAGIAHIPIDDAMALLAARAVAGPGSSAAPTGAAASAAGGAP
ncbi:hypothetical protein [Rhizobacter fulvus]